MSSDPCDGGAVWTRPTDATAEEPAAPRGEAGSAVRRAARPASVHVEGKRRTKRLKILESAVESFARQGFHGTSMDDIADHLSLTRGSLYYYFPDKEEILALCHTVALEAVAELLNEVEAADLPPAEALRRLVAGHVRIMVDKFHGSALALEIDALDPKRRQDVVASRDRFERGLRSVIEHGIASGAFRSVDPKTTAFAIFGAINWIARWYRPSGGATADDIGREFGDLFLNGLGAAARTEP